MYISPVVVFTNYGIQRLRLSLQATTIPTTVLLLNNILVESFLKTKTISYRHTYIYISLSLSIFSSLRHTEISSISQLPITDNLLTLSPIPPLTPAYSLLPPYDPFPINIDLRR